MTSFLGAPNVNMQSGIAADDQRLFSPAFRPDIELHEWSLGATGVGDFCSPWWPRAALLNDGQGYTGSILSSEAWDYFENIDGGAGYYAFTGVTRDVYGSPLGGCTVKLFKSTFVPANGIPADTLMNSTVSDASGNYTVITPYYPDPHYLVVYRIGSPDTFGTTANTLTPG